MNWHDFEKEKPEFNRKCLVKTIFNSNEEIEIGEYNKKDIWYSGCCHDIEYVKYWIYLDNI